PNITWMMPTDLFNRCVSYGEVQTALANGPGIVLRLDEYQNDWTFQLDTAPPNPLVVRAGAPTQTAVTDGVGNYWYCSPGDGKNLAVVSQQGTFRFPYSSVSAAIDRALPGWTVLIEPGHFP